ncbi:MAG TPA: amidohydrolase family protein [Chloroflexota bacterium]|nr:amidohydrolase family protein [Chloroflexota bacterium]
MSDTTWTLRGGTIVDGTGQPAGSGNVIVEHDRIVAVGSTDILGTVLDIDGLVVAPGFVDIHSHGDWIAPLADGPGLFGPNVRQGITTTVAGNCGISPAPLASGAIGAVERMPLAAATTDRLAWNWRSVAEFFQQIEQRGLPLNLCMYVGHSTLRATVMGDAARPPTPRELAAMQQLLDEGMREGAAGLSIGLEYFPGRYAGPSEISALAALLPAHGALLAAHVRGISALYDAAMAEAIAIAEDTRCRLQIAHVNPMGPANWGAIDGLFARIDAARAHGLDVGYDIVTYVAWTISVLDLLPYAVQELGADAVLALAESEDGRAHLRRQIEGARPVWPPWIEQRVTRNIVLEMGWDALVLADPAAEAFAADRGATLAELARRRERDPYDMLFELLRASRGRAQLVNVGYGGTFHDETPLRRLIQRPDAIPETDTIPVRGSDGALQLNLPLFYGTMARFLGHFCRDQGLLDLPAAIHRITALPAQRLRLQDRGVLRAGAYADLTIFNPAQIQDSGTFLQPLPARGIVHVFVNGRPTVRDTVYDPARLAGRVVRRVS